MMNKMKRNFWIAGVSLLGIIMITAFNYNVTSTPECPNQQTLKKQLKDGSTRVVAYTCGKGICNKILKMDMAAGGYHAKKVLFCE